jgi:putative hydrolase of the HAD superfamily
MTGKKPKMILFDYGQTLLNEQIFDGVRGTQAVLDCCVENPDNIAAEQIQELANELNREMRRFIPETSYICELEIHNHQFQKYLYECFNINPIVSPVQLETTFWNAASPGIPTKNIESFLDYLKNQKIRVGIISNISYSGEALTNRINKIFPEHVFEFIIATSEYVFRKPHKRIYELALKKAKLQASEVWYCGDNGICDVDGAKNIGITPVWYKGAIQTSKITPELECISIHDWEELKNILENLEE